MSSTNPSHDNVAESLTGLNIASKIDTKGLKPKAKKKQVVDSWEDDDEDEESDLDSAQRTPAVTSPTIPSPPPPTPFSPELISVPGWNDAGGSGTTSPRVADSSKRPEKTDAVARRMIAAGLGLKAPKQTEEQKAYQRSIREQEKKKKEQERAEEQRKREKIEKAKAAVWDD